MTAVIATAEQATPGVCRSHQMVIDVLLARQRHGHADTTDAEIQEYLERLHAPRRFERGWISSRISELKDRGLVVQSEHKRVDAQAMSVASATGRPPVPVRAVYLPAKQARLCA